MFKTVQMDAWVDSTLLFDTHMVICACHCLNSYFFSPYLLSNRCLSRGLSPTLFPKGLDFSPRSSALFCPQCPSKLLLFRGLHQSSLCCYALNTCSSSEADSNQDSSHQYPLSEPRLQRILPPLSPKCIISLNTFHCLRLFKSLGNHICFVSQCRLPLSTTSSKSAENGIPVCEIYYSPH